MGITAHQFEKALRAVPGALGGQPWSMQELADGANEAAAEAGITTREGLACLVAQCMIESGWYRTTTEYGSDWKRYDPYRGRSFIQLTWQRNYRMFGQWAKRHGLVSNSEHFVNNPKELSDYRWAWRGAVAYLTENNLIGRMNRGENWRVGMGIHAGDPHADSRGYPWGQTGVNRVRHTTDAYNALLSTGITAPDGSSGGRNLPGGKLSNKEIQELIGVTVDGDYGPATTKAVKELQEALDLTADGQWGPATEEAAMSLQSDINDIKKDLGQVYRWVGNNEKDIDQVRVRNHRELIDEIRKTAPRLLRERVDTPNSVLEKWPGFAKSVSVGGLLAYAGLYSFGNRDDAEEIIAAIEADQAEDREREGQK